MYIDFTKKIVQASGVACKPSKKSSVLFRDDFCMGRVGTYLRLVSSERLNIFRLCSISPFNLGWCHFDIDSGSATDSDVRESEIQNEKWVQNEKMLYFGFLGFC